MMKKIYFATIFLLLNCGGCLQGTGVNLWTKQLGTADDDGGIGGVATDASGNIYVTGYTKGSLDGNTNASLTDIFLVKFGQPSR